MAVVLRLLMPQNRLICQLAIDTGLRIGDVCALRADQLLPRVTVTEQKTGKKRRISIKKALLGDIKAQCDAVWAFPGKSGSKTGHKTRQAVWADVKRAQRALRLDRNIGPHSMRKVYAVRAYRRSGDLAAVARLLNHDDTTVTLLYALADQLAQRPRSQRRKPRRQKGK